LSHFVAEPCIKCKYTDCVAVCPVDCFYEGANMLVIHPDECIDCGACVPVCPTTAIFPQDQLPEKWHEFIELNTKYSKEWPNISDQKEPMPEAESFKTAEGKRGDLDASPFAG
jgi:ferredoxin